MGLPVLVLGLGAVLAHMMRSDADAASAPARAAAGGTVDEGPLLITTTGHDGPDRIPDQDGPAPVVPAADQPAAGNRGLGPAQDPRGPACAPDDAVPADLVAGPAWRPRLVRARAAAAELAESGQRVSRRSLRAAGVRGSNEELAAIARIVTRA